MTNAAHACCFFDEKTVVFVWLCHGIGIDLVNDFADARPDRKIRKDLHHAALVGKGRLLEHGQVFHQTVMDDVQIGRASCRERV